MPGTEQPIKRIAVVSNPGSKSLHDFVSTSTVTFYDILGISRQFMDCHPSEWYQHEKYQQSQQIVTAVKVVNDLAERGVALIQEFNSSIRRNEQKQFLLHMVENHRK